MYHVLSHSPSTKNLTMMCWVVIKLTKFFFDFSGRYPLNSISLAASRIKETFGAETHCPRSSTQFCPCLIRDIFFPKASLISMLVTLVVSSIAKSKEPASEAPRFLRSTDAVQAKTPITPIKKAIPIQGWYFFIATDISFYAGRK